MHLSVMRREARERKSEGSVDGGGEEKKKQGKKMRRDGEKAEGREVGGSIGDKREQSVKE